MLDDNMLHIEARRNRMAIEDIKNHCLTKCHVTYEGTDVFHNHWIRVQPVADSPGDDLDRLHEKLSNEMQANLKEHSDFVACDPLESFFGPNSVRLRLARSPNFQILEMPKNDDPSKNPLLWTRHESTCDGNVNDEKGHIKSFLSFGESDTKYVFDADIAFAGAFVCTEGTLASIVCRRLYRYELPPDTEAPFHAVTKEECASVCPV